MGMIEEFGWLHPRPPIGPALNAHECIGSRPEIRNQASIPGFWTQRTASERPAPQTRFLGRKPVSLAVELGRFRTLDKKAATASTRECTQFFE
jgi:hypothetical protein